MWRTDQEKGERKPNVMKIKRVSSWKKMTFCEIVK